MDPTFNGRLPTIHDLYALAHVPAALLSGKDSERIDTVINYVLDPRYQALPEGYGIMRAGPRRYYSIGWSCHLPAFSGFEGLSTTEAGLLVQRAELMAHFRATHAHPWLQQVLRHLEQFRQTGGAYRFPAGYLRELMAR